MSTFLYFAYGSNMSKRRLTTKDRAPSAKVIGTGVLDNHCLTFHKRSNDGSGKCTIEYSESHKVYGVLFEINTEDACKLDKAEGRYGNGGYTKETFKVELCHAKRKECVKTYIAKCDHIDRTLKPYTWYKQHVLVGAIEQKLPPCYIDYLMGIEAKEHFNKEKEKCELSIYAICQTYHEIVKK